MRRNNGNIFWIHGTCLINYLLFIINYYKYIKIMYKYFNINKIILHVNDREADKEKLPSN